MARPKTIYVDTNQMLRGIATAAMEDVANLREQVRSRAANSDYRLGLDGLELRDIADVGVRIDYERFADRGLTASERIRHQQAARKLADDGLVELHGERARRAKLTPLGIAKVRELGVAFPDDLFR
jgi:hypothetical protein